MEWGPIECRLSIITMLHVTWSNGWKKLVNFHFSLPIYILSRVSSRHSFVYISRSIFLIFLHSSESGSCDFLLFNHDAVQRNMDARWDCERFKWVYKGIFN